MLKDVKIPLYTSLDEDKKNTLIVNEFAGRITLEISDGKNKIEVECYWDDLVRAWNAVKRWS